MDELLAIRREAFDQAQRDYSKFRKGFDQKIQKQFKEYDDDVNRLKRRLENHQSEARNPVPEYAAMIKGHDYLEGIIFMKDDTLFAKNQANLKQYEHLLESESYLPQYQIDYVDAAFTDFYEEGEEDEYGEEGDYGDEEGEYGDEEYWDEDDEYWDEDDEYYDEEGDYWGDEEEYYDEEGEYWPEDEYYEDDENRKMLRMSTRRMRKSPKLLRTKQIMQLRRLRIATGRARQARK